MGSRTNDEPLHCPQCGYDLFGLRDERCPECGFGCPPAAVRALAGFCLDRRLDALRLSFRYSVAALIACIFAGLAAALPLPRRLIPCLILAVLLRAAGLVAAFTREAYTWKWELLVLALPIAVLAPAPLTLLCSCTLLIVSVVFYRADGQRMPFEAMSYSSAQKTRVAAPRRRARRSLVVGGLVLLITWITWLALR